MILSASGWRDVFSNDGNSESNCPKISDEYKLLSAIAAYNFFSYLNERFSDPEIIVGMDSRPTGSEIASVIIKILASQGCKILFTGVCAAPEIMAYARVLGNIANKKNKIPSIGFIYISASHNPIGYNGLKFGLSDGGVLDGKESAILIEQFKKTIENDSATSYVENKLKSDLYSGKIKKVFNREKISKKNALSSYFSFTGEVIGVDGISADKMSSVLKKSLKKQPISLVADFNGSARTTSIDKKFFKKLNINFSAINDKCGQITHKIVPEGESLEPCCRFLEAQHKKDSSFILGYVPDCDGDRGNLVVWDNDRARPLEAQEVFALCCVSEFAHLVWTGENIGDKKFAIAVNDATSMRVDKIADLFGIETFHAEVGEANVVNLARELREKGYIVRILGEGSAGGNITHPSAVRDPMDTVMSIIKLFTIRSNQDKKGFFEIWCEKSKQSYDKIQKFNTDFSIADVIKTLPLFFTTGVYTAEAILKIKTTDHSVLKNRYKEIFEQEWALKKDELNEKYQITRWCAFGCNLTKETRLDDDWGSTLKGGLKIIFYGYNDSKVASIWMRGSATEPVFRVMADVEGDRPELERSLIEWQREMVLNADKKE
jgi:phosphoglucomutase